MLQELQLERERKVVEPDVGAAGVKHRRLANVLTNQVMNARDVVANTVDLDR